jgi:hypothetical protein
MRVRSLIAVVGLLLAVTPGALAAPAASAATKATVARVPAGVQLVVPARKKPRATISASQQDLASGKVLVTVASNARKVKLTYRTASNKKRSKTVRLRGGQGSKALPAGANRIYARAKATSRLRASVRVLVGGSAPAAQPSPNVWNGDADGNGTLDFAVDFERDGIFDALILDQNGNGRFEVAYVKGPLTAGIFLDRQEDGYFEVVGIDAGVDGRYERIFEDRDQDGYPEIQWLDLIGPDGVADTEVNGSPSVGTVTENTAANDLMVQASVTNNQLRQLNPSSAGYIRYNSAPSLIRDQYPNSCLQCDRWG